MDSRPPCPSIFDYLDILAYLQDYYRFRKASQKSFSYEYWTQELDLKSRSFLRMMVSGKKKVSARFIDAFSRLNFASQAEAKYFFYLVRYSQAANSKEKQDYSSKMIQLLKHQQGALIAQEKVELISTPLLPRLLSLLCFSDLRATAECCARILKIEIAIVQEALENLELMRLAEKLEVGGEIIWVARSDTFHIPDNYGSVNLLKFHEKSLQDAIAAFEQPKQLRRYKSLLMPMSEDDLNQFNQALEDFISAQLLIYNSKNCLGTYLYQVNFNFHPVTEKINLEVIGSEPVKSPS